MVIYNNNIQNIIEKIHLWGLRGKARKCTYGKKHPKIGGGFQENIRDCKRASIGIFPIASKMCM